MTDAHTILDEARRELARLPAVLDALVGGLDEASARTRPAPGEWSPVEILCHLRDEETEDFGARLRVIVEGRGEFAPIDPERWVEERRYREASCYPRTTRSWLDCVSRRAPLDVISTASSTWTPPQPCS